MASLASRQAPSPPSGSRFGAFSLSYPEHIPRATFDPLLIFKSKDKLADRNYKKKLKRKEVGF